MTPRHIESPVRAGGLRQDLAGAIAICAVVRHTLVGALWREQRGSRFTAGAKGAAGRKVVYDPSAH